MAKLCSNLYEINQQVEFLLKEDLYKDCSTIEDIKKRFDEIILSHKTIKEACYILHNKDVKENGDAVAPHFHIFIKLDKSRNAEETVSKWFSIPLCQVNLASSFCKTNALKWAFMVLYSIHYPSSSKSSQKLKDGEKHLYEINECKTFGFNLEDYINQLQELKDNENKIALEKKQLKEEEENFDLLLTDYAEGKIQYFELMDSISTRIKIKYINKIESASKIRAKNYAALNQKKKKKIIYVYSKNGGKGKTTFAYYYAEKILKINDRRNIFQSSSQNDPFQDYKDEKVVILDDYRDSTFSYSDLLRLIDPNYSSSGIKSRYYNKVLEADTIIFTSVQNPYDMYQNVEEDKGQFYRRLSEVYILEDDNIFVSIPFKNQADKFVLSGSQKLPVSISQVFKEVSIIPETEKDLTDRFQEIFDLFK